MYIQAAASRPDILSRRAMPTHANTLVRRRGSAIHFLGGKECRSYCDVAARRRRWRREVGSTGTTSQKIGLIARHGMGAEVYDDVR